MSLTDGWILQCGCGSRGFKEEQLFSHITDKFTGFGEISNLIEVNN